MYLGTRPNELAKGFPTGDMLKHFINVRRNGNGFERVELIVSLAGACAVAYASAPAC